MDTRSTLRLQAACHGQAFRQLDYYTYTLYVVQAREAALLAMPEVQGSPQTIPDRLPMRCRAGRTRGRCRGTVAGNSVTAPFCKFHLCNGGRLHDHFWTAIMTDVDFEEEHINNRNAAEAIRRVADTIDALMHSQLARQRLLRASFDFTDGSLARLADELRTYHPTGMDYARLRELTRLNNGERAAPVRMQQLIITARQTLANQETLLNLVRAARQLLDEWELSIITTTHVVMEM